MIIVPPIAWMVVISGFGSPMDSTGVLKSDPSPAAHFADGGKGPAFVFCNVRSRVTP